METTPRQHPKETTPDIDPTADLELLKRASSSVGINHSLDFGPSWYAVALSTCLAALTVFGQDTRSTTGIVAAVIGFGAGGAMVVHDLRRRRVRPKASGAGAAMTLAILVLCWVVVGLWGTAISSIGLDRFLPGYLVLGWGLTTALFLGVRHLSYRRLARRRILA